MRITRPRNSSRSIRVSPSFNLLRPHVYAVATASIALALAGCTAPIIKQVSQSAGSSTQPTTSPYISGFVETGSQPIGNASLQLYQAGNSGDGSAATPLLSAPVKTDSTGAFSVTGIPSCTPASQIYIVAAGGNPGLAAGSSNNAAALMSALGPCANIAQFSHIVINEVTTVASVAALAPFMQSAGMVGANADTADQQLLASAFQTANFFADMQSGAAPGPDIPTGELPPTQKLSTLADILAACMQSSGGAAGDGSACGSFFSAATASAQPPPVDTIAAMLEIADDPTSNVLPIFQLYRAPGPFVPALATAPADWRLAMTSNVPPPAFSPAPGAYSSPPSVVLLDTNASAAIYYTTDGSQPTTQSTHYTGAIALPGSATISAIAVVSGLSSLAALGAYTVPAPAISLSPATVALSSSSTQMFSATVSGESNTSVAWSVNPAVGAVAASGLYSAPSSVSSAQTVTITATSVANPSISASSQVTLVPPVSVSLTPGNATLAPSQSQSFIATVSGTANSGISWSLNPALGSISGSGLYTAPSSVPSPQSLTVTATSAADPGKTASATIQLMPAGVAAPTYFVDNANGSDANSGTSAAAPFATIAKINSLALTPGQTVAFKAGDEWHETLKVSSSGTAASPIAYTSYGTGALPIISAADLVSSGWAAVSGSHNLWQLPIASNPGIPTFAGKAGTPVASTSALASPTQFYWNGTYLFVSSAGDPSLSVELSQRQYALTSAGASNIVISGLELRGASSYDAYCGTPAICTNWTFSGNTFNSSFSNEIYFDASEGAAAAKLTITNNLFEGGGSSGVKVSNGFVSTITNNTFNNLCLLYDPYSGTLENTFCDAIYGFSQNGLDQSGTYVAYNTIQNIGVGQSKILYGGGIHADTVTGWDIEHNTITNTEAAGLNLEKGHGSTARYNLMISAGFGQYQAGIMVRAGDGTTSYLATGNSDHQLVEYNTVAPGSYWGCNIQVSQNAGAVTLTNLTFQKNICSQGTSSQALYTDPGSTSTGDVYLANSFGPQGTYFIVLNGAFVPTYAALDAALGYTSGSQPGTPLFTSPSSGDYTLQASSPVQAIGAYP